MAQFMNRIGYSVKDVIDEAVEDRDYRLKQCDSAIRVPFPWEEKAFCKYDQHYLQDPNDNNRLDNRNGRILSWHIMVVHRQVLQVDFHILT